LANSDYGGYLDALVGGLIARGVWPSEVAWRELKEEADFDAARHLREAVG
jgi:ADP-ribose pyrophosphatase YjhB (NUDIX family)